MDIFVPLVETGNGCQEEFFYEVTNSISATPLGWEFKLFIAG